MPPERAPEPSSSPGDEPVALYDDRNVSVHRRTATRDLYPGRHDFCAGGMLLAGGAWVTPARLLGMLDEEDFMPDSVAGFAGWLPALRG